MHDHYLVSSPSQQHFLHFALFALRTLKKTTRTTTHSRHTMSTMNRRTKQPNAQRAAENELQAEIEKAEREANERYKQAEDKAAKAQNKNREKYLQTLRQWGPTLYLFPMIPALFGVVTICVVSIVSNTDNRQRDGNLCNGGYLNTYLLLSQVLAYFFLFGYGCMFIGTKINCLCWKIDFHCSKVKSIVKFYVFTLVVGVGINGYGAWALAGGSICAEPQNTPYTYRVAQMEAAFFWMCAIVAGIYCVWFNGKKKMERMAIDKAKRVQEDAEWEAEEAEREAYALSQGDVSNTGADWFDKGGEKKE